MAVPARRLATYADLAALPDNVIGEILDGELHASPRPAVPHARVTSSLGGVLGPPFDFGRGGPGGWWILDEPELHLGDDVLVPDLAGWRREHVPHLPSTTALTFVPDWVCEVLSESTARVDRVKKMRLYARHGVRHAWLIHPLDRTIEVYRLTDSGQFLFVNAVEGEDQVRLEPFEAIELELSLLWPEPAPSGSSP